MREGKYLMAGLALLLATVALGFAQQPVPDPYSSDGYMGPHLVAWTDMQKPQPIPEPKPDPAPLPDPQPEQQPQQPPPDHQPSSPPADETQHQPSAPSNEAEKTLVGTVVMDKERYVLRTSDQAIYQLDDQARVKPFEGKQVRIQGHLDGQMMLHIDHIEVV